MRDLENVGAEVGAAQADRLPTISVCVGAYENTKFIYRELRNDAGMVDLGNTLSMYQLGKIWGEDVPLKFADPSAVSRASVHKLDPLAL